MSRTMGFDKFISKIGGGEFSSYTQFMRAYGASCHAFLSVASNTKVIGLGKSSGIKGGSLLLKNVQNIAIRNMKIEDAFDPFPDIEKK
ncbi:hypothetical protein [Campylobacter concisus]